jgi:hypothetical protein
MVTLDDMEKRGNGGHKYGKKGRLGKRVLGYDIIYAE